MQFWDRGQVVKRKFATVFVGPQTLFSEGLALLLSHSGYKLVRSIARIDELAQGPALDGGGLFIVSSEACAKVIDSNAPVPELQTIKQQYPDARLVILSDAFDATDVVAALRAGANGYIMNTMTSDALIKSLDLVMCGETVVASEFTRAVCEQKSPSHQLPSASAVLGVTFRDSNASQPARRDRQADGHRLSSREAAILLRLTQGDSNKLIARRVGIAEATVKTHIKAILRKISVKNRTQAALWAVSNLPPVLEDDLLSRPEDTRFVPKVAA